MPFILRRENCQSSDAAPHGHKANMNSSRDLHSALPSLQSELCLCTMVASNMQKGETTMQVNGYQNSQ